MKIKHLRALLPLLSALLLPALACGDEETEEDTTPAADVDYTLSFAAVVGDTPFACGQMFPGLGSNGGEASFEDLRLYVTGVELLTAQGEAVPLTLHEDDTWQAMGVGLLDFEDGCGNGNAAMNNQLHGTAPAGEYTGVRFTLGVPMEINDPSVGQAVRPSPLNVTSMYWSWSSGYKFLRIDGQQTFKFHLGATGCAEEGAFACANVNQPAVTLDGWSEDKVITFDLGALLSGVPVAAEGEPVCHSQPDNAQCDGLFEALGLPHGGAAAGAQRVFRVE